MCKYQQWERRKVPSLDLISNSESLKLTRFNYLSNTSVNSVWDPADKHCYRAPCALSVTVWEAHPADNVLARAWHACKYLIDVTLNTTIRVPSAAVPRHDCYHQRLCLFTIVAHATISLGNQILPTKLLVSRNLILSELFHCYIRQFLIDFNPRVFSFVAFACRRRLLVSR